MSPFLIPITSCRGFSRARSLDLLRGQMPTAEGKGLSSCSAAEDSGLSKHRSLSVVDDNPQGLTDVRTRGQVGHSGGVQ